MTVRSIYSQSVRIPHITPMPTSGRNRGGADPVEIPALTFVHSPAKLNMIPPASDTTRVVTYEPSALQKFKVIRVPPGRSSGLALVRRNPFERRVPLNSNSPFPIISPFVFKTTPPELRIPLSFLGEERLQVQFSETEATDLDMRSCVLESEPQSRAHPQILLAGCGLCFGYPSLGPSSAERSWTRYSVEISRVPWCIASLCVGLKCTGGRSLRVSMTRPPWFYFKRGGPKWHGNASQSSSKARITGSAFKLHSWSLRVISSYA